MQTTGRFLHQILDTMQNWRDTMQAGLPGYPTVSRRWRWPSARAASTSTWIPRAIARLMARGADAGEHLLRTFDWERHRFLRYLTLMQLLEANLHKAARHVRGVGPRPGVRRAGGRRRLPPRPRRRVVPRGRDGDGTAAHVAAPWGVDPPPALGFERGVEPQPTPAMKVAPRV